MPSWELFEALPISSSPWLVYTEVDLDEAAAMTRSAWIPAIVVGILCGGSSRWGTIRLLEREILNPVQKLRDGAQHIRQ